MMRKLVLLGIAVSLLLLPPEAQAFNGERGGFILGLGAGFGSAKWTISAEEGSVSAEVSNTESGIATSFKIGGGISDQMLLYYSNRVVFFSVEDHSFYQGMSAVAGSYYLEPTGPSVYFTGELGIGVVADRDAGESESGLGLGLGVGYDFGNHIVVEGSYMHSTVASEGEADWSISNMTLTVNWLGF